MIVRARAKPDLDRMRAQDIGQANFSGKTALAMRAAFRILGGSNG
jgi:hypothetical protein